MAEDKTKPSELDQGKYDADDNVKIICLGDSAVGKSKQVYGSLLFLLHFLSMCPLKTVF
uniref:RAB, member of RAS oncogene family like 2B n=1 Tax=Homo sapiens TaxID=9606 RepID=A0A8I5KRY9_HUMAN